MRRFAHVMNEPYAYELTSAAINDMDEIYEYIATRLFSKESATRIENAIQNAIEHACAFPRALPPLQDPLLSIKGYRKIVVENYIVLCIPNDERRVISVMRVIYHARDYIKEL